MEENKLNFTKYQEMLASVLEQGIVVFGEGWMNGDWSLYFQSLLEEMNRHVNNQFFDYHDQDFSLSLLSEVDWGSIEDLQKSLVSMKESLDILPTEEFTIDEAEVKEILLPLLLDEETVSRFIFKLKKIRSNDLDNLLNSLKLISVKCTVLGPDLELILSALCYYQPKNPLLNFEQFSRVLEQQTKLDLGLDNWLSVFRYLGQSFIQRDAEVMFWAVDFILDFIPDQVIFTRRIDKIFFICLLHTAFWDFENDPDDIKDLLVGKYTFMCFYFGVNIKKNIERALSFQPLINDFVLRSNSLSEALLQSQENIYSEQNSSITVSNFIKKFIAFAHEGQLEGFTQLQYINQVMSEYKFNRNIREILYKILNLYLHLRECDIIDYRGFLSDEGVQEGIDWKLTFESDLSEDRLRELKEKLQLLQRPFKNKMEIVFALSKIPWTEESYLSKILTISSLFEEIYPQYSPLVFFDEQTGDWKVDKSIPDFFDISQLENFYSGVESQEES